MNKLPVLFISHGSPMNAIENNEYTQAINRAARELETPESIMVISAHWQTRGHTYINASDSPRQIYDFYGFPEELYKVQYEPPAGAKRYAEMVSQKLGVESVKLTEEWGLDHGAWAVLAHMYPNQDIPVFQMSIKYDETPEYHYNLGKKLKELRQKGILIIGSGDVVHNLRQVDFHDDAKPYKWAEEFSEYIWKAVEDKDERRLINYMEAGEIAKLALPTDEHYIPLLYAIALRDEDDDVKFLCRGIQNATIDMTSIQIG